MQAKFWFLLPVLSLFLLSAQGQTAPENPPFRIVGYYSLKAAMAADLKKVPFKQLTHVNLWFLNPDTLGNFTQDYSALAPFVQAAHKRKVKVLASIGGGTQQPYYEKLMREDQRERFIQNLVGVVLRYNLDGIDVDLEGKDIGEDYEGFVVDLARALRAQNKMITAAIAVYYKDALTDKALAQYDFVNIMSYDRTGPWRPEKPGPHATFTNAVEDLEYFGTERSIPREKMTLGVPFYGYGYDLSLASPAVSMNYGKITADFPGAEMVDEWLLPDGKVIYYNGLPTIKQKTALARDKASGIMIWQVLGDAPGSKSLLRAINKAASGKK